jgi:hypothetical protein
VNNLPYHGGVQPVPPALSEAFAREFALLLEDPNYDGSIASHRVFQG